MKGIKDIRINMILVLMLLVFLMQVFLKPSVVIKDRDWDIKLELDELQNKFNESIKPIQCNENKLKIELARKEEQIKNLNEQITIQKIMYEEFSIPLTIGRICGTEYLKGYMQELEETYK